ncbi:MAG TPA: hypothetical protein VEL76_32740 [Gemmataceae bacterium]|nr:hypothetical protein [Gemmataceae bacterium]
MALAPEPYRSACLAVLHHAIAYCRFACWGSQWSSEHVADLMDAIHNIPGLVQHWEHDHIEFLRTRFLQRYEWRWRDKGGIALREIFDEIVAKGSSSPSELWVSPFA